MTTPILLTETDAFTIVVITAEAFMSIDVATMTPEAGIGACVLFDQIMSRIEGILPRHYESLDHVFDLLATVRNAANSYRRERGIAERQ